MKSKLIFVLGVFLFLGFASVNCGAQSSANDQRIVGTWVSGNETLVFNANGSGTVNGTNFTYGLSFDGELILITDDESEVYKVYFSPDGRTLILDETVYRKK